MTPDLYRYDPNLDHDDVSMDVDKDGAYYRVEAVDAVLAALRAQVETLTQERDALIENLHDTQGADERAEQALAREQTLTQERNSWQVVACNYIDRLVDARERARTLKETHAEALALEQELLMEALDELDTEMKRIGQIALRDKRVPHAVPSLYVFDWLKKARAALQPPDAPKVAHSKSEYKRLKAMGADVVPPPDAPTEDQ